MNPVLNSSVDMGWQTPESFLELVRAVKPIAFDPCTVSSNPTKAAFYCPHDEGYNSLEVNWAEALWWKDLPKGLTFVNPPYGDELPAWIEKVVTEARAGVEQILLVPSRTDTRWYAKAFLHASCTLHWAGRIQFLDAATGLPRMSKDKKTGKLVKQSAAFPSVVFYYGPDVADFTNAFAGKGIFCRPGY